jgi:hypothetical protein
MSDVITRDQLKELIKSEEIKPSDLFGSEALTEDPTVKGFVAAEIKRAVAGEYSHRKRDEEGSLKVKAELEEKLKAKDDELRKLQIEAAKVKVGSLFEKQKTERKLDERQVKFIQSRLAKFEPIKIEDLEKEFNLHLDGEIEEYKRISKDVFGIEEQPTGDGKAGDGGTGPETKPASSPENKYLDPAQNPMIKTVEDI